MAKLAYVRVSSADQNEQRQIEALKPHGIEKWYTEKISAKYLGLFRGASPLSLDAGADRSGSHRGIYTSGEINRPQGQIRSRRA